MITSVKKIRYITIDKSTSNFYTKIKDTLLHIKEMMLELILVVLKQIIKIRTLISKNLTLFF